jgi:hypothetical protein
MQETVRDSKEFECVMKDRAEKMAFRGGPYRRLNTPIACHQDGTPLKPSDKRTMCELEKLALGMKRAYMQCGSVVRCDIDRFTGRARELADAAGLKDGDWFRLVYLYFDRDEALEEEKFLDRLLGPILIGKKFETPAVPGSSIEFGGGSFCAYPGGCD